MNDYILLVDRKLVGFFPTKQAALIRVMNGKLKGRIKIMHEPKVGSLTTVYEEEH